MNTVVYPPNKQLDRDVHFSKTPVIYDNFLFVDFNREGNCILGCSNVAGTLWEGNLLYFNSSANLLNLKYDNHYIHSTASDALFITDEVVAVAEDTGLLNVLKVNSDTRDIESVNYFKHFDIIPRIATWTNTSKILTCSGRDLNIWDVYSGTKKPVNTFAQYHGCFINCVDTFKAETNLFLSAASDRKCCIWDDRNAVPCTVLYHNEFCSLTSVAWNQKDVDYIVVGTEGGDVYLIDKRQPNDFVSNFNCFDSSVHRISFNGGQVGVCGEGNEVLILDSDSDMLKEVYRSDTHKDIVRGLAWHEGSLYSCGFDKAVIKHVIKGCE